MKFLFYILLIFVFFIGFTFVEYVDPMWVKYMWWIYFIGLIWTSEFIMACQQMVIAGSVAHWYYRYKLNINIVIQLDKLN